MTVFVDGKYYSDAEFMSLPDLPNAETVRASGCTGLTSLPDLPNAETVEVSGCTGLTHFCGHKLPDEKTIKDRLTEVAVNALASERALEMSTWHTCETTHCLAGWAIALAGDEGKKLESKYGSAAAGTILLGVEVSNWFYLPNNAAREKLRAVLADAC